MEVFNFTQNVSRHIDQNAISYHYSKEFSLTVKSLAPFWPAIISFGLISNIINITVFLKTGAKDNVTILLLSLAASDLLFLMLVTPSMCGYFIRTFRSSHAWPFDQHILLYLLYWPAFTAYDLSAFISVSLGVMRCACVAMPLKFKLVFTRSRTIKWVMFLVVLAVSLRIPVLTIYSVSSRLDPQTNVSSTYLKDANLDYMSRINDILNRGMVIYILYITMVVCVAVLTSKLYQASKIRRVCTTVLPKTSDQVPDKPVAQGLSSKDIQVVKSVVLVCTIFILSQLTFLVTSTVRLIKPEFNGSKGLVFLFGIFSQVSRTGSYLNASMNIFVYYTYNSRYRYELRSMLSLK